MKFEIAIIILLSITSLLMPLLTYKLGIMAGKKSGMRKASTLFQHHQAYLHDR